MNLPCPNVIPCPGTDNPFANLSSEGPDRLFYKKVSFFRDKPPLGATYTKLACAVVFNSDVSQEDADEQAAIAAAMCVHDTWDHPPLDGGPGPGEPFVTYFNSSQTCVNNCPDGSPFSYTVGAGRFAGLSQAAADAAAYSFACYRAKSYRICLSDISEPVCNNVEQNVVIYLQGATISPMLFEIVSGTVPTGMVFNGGVKTSPSVSITGIPTVVGPFSFTVKCTNGNGDYMTRSYTLKVAGLLNSLPLDFGSIGNPYSLQLDYYGFNIPVFTIIGGALPDGLSMDSNGLITGTPTTFENPNFVIKVEEFLP